MMIEKMNAPSNQWESVDFNPENAEKKRKFEAV